MHNPDVSICIPAWRAEAFIGRTLGCARAQTYGDVHILVSVDRSHDATAAICEAHARDDPRIRIYVQDEALGWARNVNFLLDRVETPLFFLYFHDDIIEPTYVERLVDALAHRPDAASAHCDVGLFGGDDTISVGRSYEGSAFERCCAFLVAPIRGEPLRAMTRRDRVGRLRLPVDAPAGFHAHLPYQMELIAAGPALHVPEVLYRRWHERKGGLTDGWLDLTADQVRTGARAAANAALEAAGRVPSTPAEREVLRFCVFLLIMAATRGHENHLGTRVITSPVDLHESFADLVPPNGLADIDPRLREWAMTLHAMIDHWPA